MDGAELEVTIAALALVAVVWLSRELLLARRWRRLIDAIHELARVVDDLAVVIVDELERDEVDGPGE